MCMEIKNHGDPTITYNVSIFLYLLLIFFRLNMNRYARTNNNSSSDDEQPTRSTNDTYTFLENCVLNADHKALEEHLVSNPVQQSHLDRCLVRGLQIVQRKEKELSQMTQTLIYLLHLGAKWNSDVLLDEQKTPYHIICASPGDHHELLDMMIKSSQQRTIDAQDSSMSTAMMYAVRTANINCLKCLIANRADVKEDYNSGCVWSLVARLGNVELLKCLFNRGIDKDSTDRSGMSVLWWVIHSGNVEAVRYLLDIGVAIPNYAPNIRETQGERSKNDRLIVKNRVDRYRFKEGRFTLVVDLYEEYLDPCMRAICDNRLEIIKLLDERGSQSYKSFFALRRAVICGNVVVASYLLNKYTYDLDIEYTIKNSNESRGPFTLLTEPGQVFTANITKLLLDHGADPAKPMCEATSVNAIMNAICYGNLQNIAKYIRSGVDINFRSYDGTNMTALPFETSVLCGHQFVAKMLLVSGCLCGVFSLRNNHNLKPELEKLMKEWKVQENNVTPLQQRCRNVILNHLSPRANLKIGKLPLPRLIIKFLSIPELDDILEQQARTTLILFSVGVNSSYVQIKKPY